MPDCETQALIAALEERMIPEAEEGSRELDARVAVAAKVDLPSPMGEAPPYLKTPTMADGCTPGTYWLVQRSGMSLRTAPHYTTSIDAALTLVPEGWYARLNICHSDGDAEAWVVSSWDTVAPGTVSADTDDIEREHIYTPALALCIAALKARSLRARESGEHQTIAEMTAVSPEELNRPVTNFNASRRKP